MILRAVHHAGVPAMLLAAAAWTGAAAGDGDDRCVLERSRRPHDPYSAECFDASGIPVPEQNATRDRIAAWAAEQPEDPWALVARANNIAERDSASAVDLCRRAAESFAALHDAAGEAYARYRLVYPVARLARYPEAEEALASARAIPRAGDDPLFPALDAYAEMSILADTDRCDTALLIGRQAVAAPRFADLPRITRWHVALLGTGAAGSCGQLDDLRRFSLLALDALADPNDAPPNAARFDAEFRALAADQGLGPVEDAESALARAYDLSVTHRVLWAVPEFACKAAQYATRPDDIRTWVERCAGLARQYRCFDLQSMAERVAAERLAESPDTRAEAVRLAERALAQGRASGVLAQELDSATTLAYVRSLTQSRSEAEQAYEDLLVTIERYRGHMEDPDQRAALFSVETGPYRYAAFLSLDPDGALPAERERAFTVLEQARARSLEDALAAARGHTVEPVSGAGAAGTTALASLRTESDAIRARLQSGSLSDAQTGEALQELDGVDAEETKALIALQRSDPASGGRPAAATVAAVQAALSADEALLSYQLPVYPGGRPWAFALTRDSFETIRLPDEDLRSASDLYRGMLQRRDGAEREAGRALSTALFDPVLARLGGTVRRLLVIADGPLWEIPISALPGSGGEPLTTRYEISLIPSATVWLAWRSGAKPPPGGDGLGVADPSLPDRSSPEDASTRWALAALGDGGGLPRAREEVAAMKSALGGGSVTLVGREASEAAFKRQNLQPFGVLHFAAHALVNQLRPSRSGILLARDASEDGLLDAREITTLPLGGKLVVLSSCGTAEGRYAAGEGALSLAHAFLGAGARAVVSTLWPVGDRDAAELVEAFYDHLGRGEDAGSSLAHAQRDRAAAGAPPAAWAAFELVGDGGFLLPVQGRPASGVQTRPASGVTWFWPGALALLAAVAVLIALGTLRLRRA